MPVGERHLVSSPSLEGVLLKTLADRLNVGFIYLAGDALTLKDQLDFMRRTCLWSGCNPEAFLMLFKGHRHDLTIIPE